MATVRQESKLKRNITFWPLIGICYGQIIGAGIMTNTGIAIGMTGTGVVIAYAISALCTLFTNYPAAILGACLPVTGGNYRYITRLHSRTLGVIFLMTTIVGNLTLALYALSCSSYIVAFFSGVSQQVIAIAILVICFGINLIGNKQSALVTTGITVALLMGMALFLAFGLPKSDLGFVFAPSNIMLNGPGNFLSSLALLSFATGGAQVVASMGSEIVDPHKNIPKAMTITTLTTGVLYALVATVATGVLPLDVVANQNLSLVARDVMPNWAFFFFTLAAGGGATFKTLNVTLSHISKPLLVAAEDGLIPKWLAKVSDRGVPVVLLTMFFFIGLTPLLLGIDISLISRMGTAISLINKVIFSYAFMGLPKKYPKEMANSVLKVSEGGVKFYGWGSAIMSAVFSWSLIVGLPKIALIMVGVLVVLAFIYSQTPYVKSLVIPDDLAVDYIASAATATAGASEEE